MSYVCAYSSEQLDKSRVEKEFTENEFTENSGESNNHSPGPSVSLPLQAEPHSRCILNRLVWTDVQFSWSQQITSWRTMGLRLHFKHSWSICTELRVTTLNTHAACLQVVLYTRMYDMYVYRCNLFVPLCWRIYAYGILWIIKVCVTVRTVQRTSHSRSHLAISLHTCSSAVDVTFKQQGYSSTAALPSALWHCWLGHLTRKKAVPKMTYNVSVCGWWDVKPWSINLQQPATLSAFVTVVPFPQ